MKPKAGTAAGRPTMADVAQIAGVSKITVSRALADSPLVRAKVRADIQALARRMGYRLNVAARDLRLQQRRTVAVVVEMAPSDERPMSEPYPLMLLGGIMQELASAGYAVLLTMSEQATPAEVSDANGVILLGQGSNQGAVQQLASLPIPLVVWGAASADSSHIVVGSDNRDGGARAADYLVGRGRRRLVYLGDTDHAEMADRFGGFAKRLGEARGTMVTQRTCGFTTEAGMAATTELLREEIGIDGIFACSDLVAVGAVKALIAAGRAIPDDVSVVGYDDAPIAAAFIPAITTIRQNWTAGGRLLAAKLLELLEGGSARSEMLPTTLVERTT